MELMKTNSYDANRQYSAVGIWMNRDYIINTNCKSFA